MNQQNKELLLKDLSARLPYQPIVRWNNTDVVLTPIMLPVYIENCKPYLRPLSSMTEEEWKECQNLEIIDWVEGDVGGIFINAGTITDWLNKYHFDYRGLIERELAIDCTNLNVY